MEELVPGVKYLARSINGSEDQEIVFMSKQSNREFHENKAGHQLPDYFFEAMNVDPEEVNLVQDGTSNEEIIKVLLCRTSYLNEKLPCDENEQAIYHLRQALESFRKRTADRKSRNVENTTVA